MFALSLLTLSLLLVAYALPAERRAPARVITACTVPNTIALTFDDGPYQYLDDVSNALTNAGARGTFFFNGNNYACIYDENEVQRVRRVYNAGHQIASHTWSHAHLPTLSWDQKHDEFFRVEQALQKIAGVVPAFMRPPYGEYNDEVREVAGQRGQTVVNWDFDSGDSVGASVAESNRRYDEVVSQHPSTLLALNHEVYETTAHQVLPHAIEVLQGAGYRLVTLAECLGEQPYQSIGSPGVRDGSWSC